MVEQNRLTAEAQWQQLAERWNGIFDREIARWKHVGLDVEYVHGVGEMRFQKDAEGIFQDAQRALQEMRETSDWRDIEKLPEYQNYLREMERVDSAADRAGDPQRGGHARTPAGTHRPLEVR